MKISIIWLIQIGVASATMTQRLSSYFENEVGRTCAIMSRGYSGRNLITHPCIDMVKENEDDWRVRWYCYDLKQWTNNGTYWQPTKEKCYNPGDRNTTKCEVHEGTCRCTQLLRIEPGFEWKTPILKYCSDGPEAGLITFEPKPASSARLQYLASAKYKKRQLEAGATNTAALVVYEFTAALTGQEADAADGGSIISGIPDVYTISGIVIIGAAAVLAAIGFSVFFWGRRGERARGKREDRSEDSDASGQSNAVVEVGSNESEQTPGETAKAEEKAEGKAEEV